MEETISQRLEKLEREYSQTIDKPPKEFKLPLTSRMQKGKVLKKEWIHVIMIRTNGSMQVKTCKIEDSTVKFGEYFYDARAGNILRWKGMPVLLLKEWDISPEAPPEKHTFDPEKSYKDASKAGRLTAAQKLILTKMKMEAIKPKMKLSGGVVLIILLVLGGGYFLLSSMGAI